jgi:hypothetical protein
MITVAYTLLKRITFMYKASPAAAVEGKVI